jgi:prepilin-type N-terminal cleavage/methylation domain-containing protein
MKKSGFTLAEILITLTIIGVVSALVLPTFTSSIQKQKIGPKLAKAVAVFEQAAQSVLDDTQSDAISGAIVKCNSSDSADAALTTSGACFANQLGHHIKGDVSGETITGTDGISYTVSASFDSSPTLFPDSGTASLYAHENKIMNSVRININASAGNPSDGYELFYFYMMDDGTLIPYGSSRGPEAEVWSAEGNCRKEELPGKPQFCAGHILENNLKVEYK